MGRFTTVGGWSRGARRLAAVGTLVGSLVALGGALAVGWLALAGAVIGVVVVLAGLVAVFGATHLEARRERAEHDQRLRVRVQPVDAIDPTRVGVDPAAQDILDGDEVPVYVPRDVDAALRAAVAKAVDGSGEWIVVATGSSKVGKSRALFEALRAHGGLDLVAPVNGDALRSLIAPGGGLTLAEGRTAVLWLDDLEPFMNQDVTLETLRQWRRVVPDGIVVATNGGKGSDRVANAESAELSTVSGEILPRAARIPMAVTRPAELKQVRDEWSPEQRAAIDGHGLAAYLVAAPKLEDKLSTARHEPGSPECHEGAALVRAAVDWARCGRTDSIERETLRELWPGYLPPGIAATDQAFDTAWDWACKPVAGTIALARDEGGLIAYDYVVRYVIEGGGSGLPSDEMWEHAIAGARDAQAMSVATLAYLVGSFDLAARGWRAAMSSDSVELAADAHFNLAVTLGDMERWEDALAAYQDLLDNFGDAPEAQEKVAKALYYKGVALSSPQLDASSDGAAAIACYQEVIDRFGATPELSEQVADARLALGVAFAEVGQREKSLAMLDGLIEDYSDDEARASQVAGALVDRGILLGESGYEDRELDDYNAAIALDDPDGEAGLRRAVAKALVNKAAMSDDVSEAMVLYATLAERFGGEWDPAVAAQVALGQVNKGAVLEEMGDDRAALDEYRAVVERLRRRKRTAHNAPLIPPLVRALFAQASVLLRTERRDEAMSIFDDVLEGYGDESDPDVIALVDECRVIRAGWAAD